MKMVLSYHAEVERKERFDFIRERIGFTNIVMEGVFDNRRFCITSSGVLIIKGMDDVVITAYLATLEVATFVSRGIGKSQIPPKLYKKILKNMDRYPQYFR